MSEMSAEPTSPGPNNWAVVQGWKEYHDAISEGRVPSAFSPRALAIYQAIESNPGTRQAFLDYIAATGNDVRMPHISQGDGMVHRNPADMYLEQAQLLSDLGGEAGTLTALNRAPHDPERQLAIAELIAGLVNMAMAHGDAAGIGNHVINQGHPQYQHGPPATWHARPPEDFPGFGAPGPEPHAHTPISNADHSGAASNQDNPVPPFDPHEGNYSSPDGQQLHIDPSGHPDNPVPPFDPHEGNYSSPDGQQLHIDPSGHPDDGSSHDGPGFHVTDVAPSHDGGHDGPGFDVTGVDGSGGP